MCLVGTPQGQGGWGVQGSQVGQKDSRVDMIVGQGLSERSEATYLPGILCALCACIWAGFCWLPLLRPKAEAARIVVLDDKWCSLAVTPVPFVMESRATTDKVRDCHAVRKPRKYVAAILVHSP